MDKIKLIIYSPKGIIVDEYTSSVTIPGKKGSFTVLKNHAPLISSLTKGTIKYSLNNEVVEIHVEDGFVEIKNNVISVSLESIYK